MTDRDPRLRDEQTQLPVVPTEDESPAPAADTEKGAASIAFFPDETVGYRIH